MADARPGAWAIFVTIHGEADAAAAWSNQPAANTFLFNSHRHVQLVNLAGMTQVRFVVNKQATAAATGATMRLVFATSFSTNVANYTDIGLSPVQVGIDTTNTVLDSGWVELVNEARDDVYLAVVGAGGNGTADPAFGVIAASFA